MSVGLPVTKNEIDSRAGDIARAFQDHFGDVVTMQNFLTATVDADLVEMGYTADEVASLKTAFADLMQLGDIWRGAAPLPAAKDFRVFVSRLWGVGAF
jgi:hypothetical protein